MKKSVRLNEEQLKQIIKEAVDGVMRQQNIETSMPDKAQDERPSSLDRVKNLEPIKQKAQKVANDVNEMWQIVKQMQAQNQMTSDILRKSIGVMESLLPVLKQTGNRGAMQEMYDILNRYSGRNIAANSQESVSRYQTKYNTFRNDFMDMWNTVTNKTALGS